MDSKQKKGVTGETAGNKQEIKKEWNTSRPGQQQKGTQQGGFNPQGGQTGKK